MLMYSERLISAKFWTKIMCILTKILPIYFYLTSRVLIYHGGINRLYVFSVFGVFSFEIVLQLMSSKDTETYVKTNF